MQKSDFTLFWAAVPTQVDYDNLIASGVERVMLTFQLARTRTDVLARLAGINRRAVIRIEGDNTNTPATIAQSLSTIRHVIPIEAVIAGCEPDAGCDMRIGSPSWCQDEAYASVARVSALIAAIEGLGLMAVSPAMSYPPDAVSEDGTPLPGRTTFREIVAPIYQRANGCGVHIYALGWAKDQDPPEIHRVNEDRFKWGLKWATENWHLPIWIDEVGVILASDIDKMKAYIRMADIVRANPGVSARVRMLCPFISAGSPGNPPAWDTRYLIKDRVAYELLGQWMRS